MPSRTKQKNAEIAARSAALPKLPKELMDQLVSGPMTGDEVNAATLAFKKALIERVMGAELGHHLGHAEAEAGNFRNGTSGKTVITGEGPVRLEIPRDRNGSFEPLLIPKHERRFTGFDEKRSGSACLNSKPRFISGLRAGCKRCRVVHGGGRRLRRTGRRGGQLGAHQGSSSYAASFSLSRPAKYASSGVARSKLE